MNKKIIIIIVVIIIAVTGTAVWLVLSRTKKTLPVNPPNSYSLLTTELNGSVNAKVIVGADSYDLSSTDLDKYGLITFNSSHDLMWIECAYEYNSSNPTSATQNKITSDPILKASNIELKQGKENSLQIDCKK